MNHRSFFPFLLLTITAATSFAADLRIGMIGLDTSHATEFTRRFNDPADKGFVPGARVVAAVRQSSPDIEDSWKRMPAFSKTMEDKYGVKMVDSIDEMLKQVDVVMVESVDGRPHLAQTMPALKAHKPVFLDKPAAASLRDVIEIYRAAREYNTPIYSGSSMRFATKLQELKAMNVGELRGAISIGPAHTEAHHPDLYWYGIHPTEALYTIMGSGCETVACTTTKFTHVVTGVWKDGKVGTLRGTRGGIEPYRIEVLGSEKMINEDLKVDYTPFLREVVKFFQTGVAPVTPEETLEIYAFMEAADESKRQGGCPVKIADVMLKAEAEKR